MGATLEIRWHGRGGQGAKTAALLLGEALMEAGKHVQAFPEFGPERRGAPVQAFNRISDEPITIHSAVRQPQMVVVLDPSFLGTVDVLSGLQPGGILLVNTPRPPEWVREKLGLENPPFRICTLDASGIAKATLGRDIPNAPMLGAIARLTGLVSLEELLEQVRHRMEKKFSPRVIEGNLAAIRRAYEEVHTA